MFTKDDEDWIALLQGKEVPDANPDTLDEVRALKIALHTELQWQKLQARIQADKAKNIEFEPKFWGNLKRVLKNSLWEPIYNWLNWKPLALVAAGTAVYTVVVVKVTVSFIAPVPVPVEPFPAPKIPALTEELLPKSSSPVQNNACSSGYFPYKKRKAEQKALSMKQQIEFYGGKVTSYEKINDKAFLLEILPPKKIPQELTDFWEEKEGIDIPLLPNCRVGFIFIAPE